ncbi:Alpha/Beta hydrolase protein [Roridomyces roridus]|uniref:Alpha/Beta hydrolase protein n=1 Tax=Roridomyces roridus TaxID=1738132 RepID=A0AAD7C1R7_9AGAR|nr:Alpha/Beta hydrolase protein [Roridomyces roridus]
MPDHTEHTLKLPDGIDILYTDSGAPNSPFYTTLLMLHGSGFSGDGLVGLHAHAHKNNLRLIIWNRRDYRGSTKYTDAELEDLKAGRKVFQDRLAMQMAWFLEHFIRNENTPKLSEDRKTGGFILAGWSFGNATLLSLFSDPGVLPKELYEIIEPYVMSFVLYDPPYTALGYTAEWQPEVYDPWTDPDYPTPAGLYDNFQHWVSSYYKHPDVASGKPSGMSFEKRTERRTYTSWSNEQKASYFDTTAAVRCELPAYAPPMQATLKEQTYYALLDPNIASAYFPDVNVLQIYGAASPSYCIWAYLESLRMYRDAGEKVRPVKFKLVEDANHFMHYDLPDLFLREVVRGCTEN